MDLFSTETLTNLLPYDGLVIYYGKVLKQQDAQHYLDCLLKTIEWKKQNISILLLH